jgi:thiol-disulfide isomerase/thioredoxin
MAASLDRTDRLVARTTGWANALLAVALGATLMTVAWPRVQHAFGLKAAPAPAAYRAGQTIDVPADWYQAAPYTVVVFARSSCSACQQAQPFLQQLVASVKGRGEVVLGTPGMEREEDLRYGLQLGLDASQARVVPPGLRVKATPTLVIVNRRGEILGAWEGVGPPEQQAKISQAITAAMASGL